MTRKELLFRGMGLASAGVGGLAFARATLGNPPPGFCVKHPNHPSCRTTTSSTTTTAPTTTAPTTTWVPPPAETVLPWAWSQWFGEIVA